VVRLHAYDALSGLARGFFFAGAKSLLVTHWEVESQSAAHTAVKTMEKYVSNRSISRSQALQQTAIDLIDAKTPAMFAFNADRLLDYARSISFLMSHPCASDTPKYEFDVGKDRVQIQPRAFVLLGDQ